MIAHFRIDLEIPFAAYPTKKLNEKAVRSLRKSIKEMLEDHKFFDLFVEAIDTEDGPDLIADATDECKSHVIFIRVEE